MTLKMKTPQKRRHLKNEHDLKNEDDLKYVDDLKMKTTLKMKMTQRMRTTSKIIPPLQKYFVCAYPLKKVLLETFFDDLNSHRTTDTRLEMLSSAQTGNVIQHDEYHIRSIAHVRK